MIQKILHIILAFLLFHSSVGIVIGQHYCRGELKDISFFGMADNSHSLAQKANQATCPLHQKMAAESTDTEIDKKPCCSDKTDYFSIDIEQTSIEKTDLVITTIAYQPSILTNIQTANTQFVELRTHSTSFKEKPPLPYADKMTAYLQTFLL